MDQLWRPTEIGTLELDVFVRHSEQEGIFKFGRCDLHIEDQHKKLEFRLCHESDIHFESAERPLVDQVIALWQSKGFTLYVSPGPKGSTLRGEWQRIDAHAN